MRDTTEPPKARGARDQDGRAVRLAEALRANLARRKAQKRARDAAAGPDDRDDDGQNDGNGQQG